MNDAMSTAGQAAGLAHPTEAREAPEGIPEGGRCAGAAACSAEGAHPPASQQAPQGLRKPNVYTSAKATCCALKAAVLAAQPPYYLRLSDREFLNLYFALERDRSRTRKAIGKGLAEPGDLRASDSTWSILQDVMTRRMKGYRL